MYCAGDFWEEDQSPKPPPQKKVLNAGLPESVCGCICCALTSVTATSLSKEAMEAGPKRAKKAPKADRGEAQQSKKLVCQACRARPGPDVVWHESEWRGRTSVPKGHKCRACHEVWAAAFQYLSWEEFTKMSESEETGCRCQGLT